MLLGTGVGVATIMVVWMAYFSSPKDLTTSFHSKDVLSGSRDSTALAQCALHTFAANPIKSLSICVLRVRSSVN